MNLEASPSLYVVSPNTEDKPLRPINISPQESFDDVFTFGNSFAHVSIMTKDLRNDLVFEAIKRGVDPERAKSLANKTEFYFAGDDLKRPKERREDYIDYLFRRTLPRTLAKKFSGEIGAVVGNETYGARCFLDIEDLIKRAEKNGIKKEYFNIPSSIPIEARKIAAVQLCDAIWRHEREHIIQIFFPKTEHANTMNIKDGVKFLLKELPQNSVVRLGLLSLLLNEMTTVAIDRRIQTFLLTYSVMKIDTLTRLYMYQNSKGEVEAFEQMKAKYARANSPFNITFEN